LDRGTRNKCFQFLHGDCKFTECKFKENLILILVEPVSWIENCFVCLRTTAEGKLALNIMEEARVSFEYNGKHYQGILSQVSGAGATVWHLTINNYYRGMLMYTDKWVFYNNKNEMQELADFFGDQVNESQE
jgi:hypothetical protein